MQLGGFFIDYLVSKYIIGVNSPQRYELTEFSQRAQ